MAFSLQFDVLHRYAPSQSTGIPVPVSLSIGSRSVAVTAKLDTGASICIFSREYGEELGLDIEQGLPARIGTPTGGLFQAFGHTVTLDVLGIRLETIVYFAEYPDFPRSVLGRRGCLDRLSLALSDYDGRLYLSRGLLL